MIAFSCQRCATHFKVPDSLAGKKAHCKKCGQGLRVPQAPVAVAAVAATGVFRMGAVQADRGSAERTRAATSKPDAPSALPSLSLVPIPSQDELQPVAKREPLWQDDDGVEYELEQLVEQSPAKAVRMQARPHGSVFWDRGGIAEVLLIALRKLSDYTYLVSVPFLLLMLTAIILKQRELAIAAVVIVVLLNVGRLCLDGFVLVTLAFKNGLAQGVLFFLPPFTFYYLSKRGPVMQEAMRRFLGAALPIVGVLLLAIIVPWLRGGDKQDVDAPIQDRLRNDLLDVRESIKTKIKSPADSDD
jgi:hypothetical protein